MPIALPVTREANELLSRNALALLIGMLLDQSMKATAKAAGGTAKAAR